MNGISQCIAQSRQLVIQAIEFNNKRMTQEQGTSTRIFCIEISRIGISLSFDKLHETGSSNTLVNMIGHHRISHQRGLRVRNGQCKRIKIIEVILFITAADLAASRQANMVSIFHTAKFHLIIRVKKRFTDKFQKRRPNTSRGSFLSVKLCNFYKKSPKSLYSKSR